VPTGFSVTSTAYCHMLDQDDAWPRLHKALAGLDADNVDDLARRAQLAREIVYGAALPVDLTAETAPDTLYLGTRTGAQCCYWIGR
jgi:pyruvate,water dikinase